MTPMAVDFIAEHVRKEMVARAQSFWGHEERVSAVHAVPSTAFLAQVIWEALDMLDEAK